jgi:pyridinium-3,5-biscarboxylic acid mononucleotide synthase
MDTARLRSLLEALAAGTENIDGALEKLRSLPFEDIGFAKIDHHRQLRKGYPETIFCAGKTPEQVAVIVEKMRDNGSNVLGTRCSSETAEVVAARCPEAIYNATARCITLTVNPPPERAGYIGVICAGTSDLPVAEEAAITCEALGNRVKRVCDVGVAGLHRLLDQREILEKANVLIVCAGMEGALPSVVAGLVTAPVIGVPTSIGYGASFGGIAALLGMLNSCATGLTVVNIDNGFGAAIAASTINAMASEPDTGE